MLIYEKYVDGVRHLFGTTANIPDESDVQLTYKDAEGKTVEVSLKDSYVDDGKHGIIRISDKTFISAWIGDTNVIPGGDYKIADVTDTAEDTATGAVTEEVETEPNITE